jgi:hypothetical protein
MTSHCGGMLNAMLCHANFEYPAVQLSVRYQAIVTQITRVAQDRKKLALFQKTTSLSS